MLLIAPAYDYYNVRFAAIGILLDPCVGIETISCVPSRVDLRCVAIPPVSSPKAVWKRSKYKELKITTEPGSAQDQSEIASQLNASLLGSVIAMMFLVRHLGVCMAERDDAMVRARPALAERKLQRCCGKRNPSGRLACCSSHSGASRLDAGFRDQRWLRRACTRRLTCCCGVAQDKLAQMGIETDSIKADKREMQGPAVVKEE